MNVCRSWLMVVCLALVACEAEPKLSVVSFEASPATIDLGDSSILTWVATGEADAPITLTPGDINLTGVTSYDVSPTETTLYTLQVGDKSKTVSVSVNPPTSEPAPPDPAPEGVSPLCESADERVVFKDARLMHYLRESLKSEGVELNPEGVTCAQMARLKTASLGHNQQAGYSPEEPIKDLGGLEYAHNLEALRLTDFVAPLDPLLSLGKLSAVDFNQGAAFNDMTPLERSSLEVVSFGTYLPEDMTSFTKIESLKRFYTGYITDYTGTDLASVAAIPNLETLWLAGNPESPGAYKPIDISPLTQAKALKALHLEDVTLVAGLASISSLTQLTSLMLESSGDVAPGENRAINQLSSLEFIAPLVNLEALCLRNVTRNISDISPLVKLTKLRDLTLTDSQVSDISVLLALPWAADDDSANLFGNPITLEQIEALKEKVATVNF